MQRQRIVQDVGAALRFYTRLPVPAAPGELDAFAAPSLPRMAYAVPLAGAVVGLIGGLILLLGAALGLPPLVSSALAVTALVLATGAFHEDGLADTADGFGGGATKARRLEIMRDSRIGTYGASALVLSLLLRVALLQGLLVGAGPLRAALALVAAEAISRGAALLLLEFLPPARVDGASAAAGRPGPDAAGKAGLMGALVAAVAVVPSLGVGATLAGLGATLLGLFVMTRLSRRMIGGQTGDVAGATQQVTEIAFLLAALMFARAS